ncbi:prepilin-type N-terminal cleavage/methylation domain-containing protein [Patescibacteria group bacterium]|nr:MAG: prepilin-type N-terminal cleavage/methylation domain-containing protein [Patescibacteria group bacterium]
MIKVKKLPKTNDGFTILELVIVMIAVVILVAVVFYFYG